MPCSTSGSSQRLLPELALSKGSAQTYLSKPQTQSQLRCFCATGSFRVPSIPLHLHDCLRLLLLGQGKEFQIEDLPLPSKKKGRLSSHMLRNERPCRSPSGGGRNTFSCCSSCLASLRPSLCMAFSTTIISAGIFQRLSCSRRPRSTLFGGKCMSPRLSGNRKMV